MKSTAYGWNDTDGTVHCGFCSWTKRCNSMEQVEHELNQHLAAAHGRRSLFRVEDESGRKIDIPHSNNGD